MKYLYTGTTVDTLDFHGKEVYLTPESEIELSDEFQQYAYFQRLIALGLLKAVSPAPEKQEAAK
jgi:hypothetical protein